MAESVREDGADDAAAVGVNSGAAAAVMALSSVPSQRPHLPSECLADHPPPASADHHSHRCFGSAHDPAPLDKYSCVLLHFLPLDRHSVG